MNDLSYSLGATLAKNLKQQGFSIESFESFNQGFKNVFLGEEIALTEEEMNEVIGAELQRLSQKQFERNISEGKEFLEKNAKREGVNVLPSGLQYEVLQEGNGVKPTLTSNVTTHYHGMLIDGTVFDSSVQRGTPMSFPVNGVIKGWTEALLLMQTGAKWRLYVPYNLAYGERGAGQLITPYSSLIFDVELISID